MDCESRSKTPSEEEKLELMTANTTARLLKLSANVIAAITFAVRSTAGRLGASPTITST
jgi:hypothetical protein